MLSGLFSIQEGQWMEARGLCIVSESEAYNLGYEAGKRDAEWERIMAMSNPKQEKDG